MPRKKQEWTSTGCIVACVECGSRNTEWLDNQVRSGVYERHTRCVSCGAQRTTKIEAGESAPIGAAKLAQAIAEGPGDPAVKTKLIGAIEAAAAGAPELAGKLASDAIALNAAQEAAPAPARTPPAGKIEWLRFDQLHPDSVQPREQMDLGAIADYSAAMLLGEDGQLIDLRGDDWAPIVVYCDTDGKRWLADGFHRVRAAREAGHQGMQAMVFAGGKSDALLHAVGANVRNGVRITNADKRRAVGLLLGDARLSAKKDTEIAALCCVSQPFVSKMRGELRQRTRAVQTAERAREDRAEEGSGGGEGYDNRYSEAAPAPLQFDIEETIAQKQRRQAEEEEEAAERRAEAEKKRIEQEQRDSWGTPPEFLDSIVRPILEVIDLDAASNAQAQEVVQATRWFSLEDDALTQDWEGRVWLNPPYSHPLVERFALKAIEEFKSGRVKQLLMLVNSSTSSVWWHELAKACNVVAFPLGRLSFWSPHGLDSDNNRNSSTVFYFGQNEYFVFRHLHQQGYFTLLSPKL